MNSATFLSASRAPVPLRTLGLSSASRAEVPGAQWASVPPCPQPPHPPPKSQLHSWCFAIVVGAARGWCRRGWALGTGTGADRLWSAVSMQVTFAGTATRPARPRTEWRRSWVPAFLHRVPSGPHTTCFLFNWPLGSIQLWGIFLAFSASGCLGSTLGH